MVFELGNELKKRKTVSIDKYREHTRSHAPPNEELHTNFLGGVNQVLSLVDFPGDFGSSNSRIIIVGDLVYK